MCAGHRGPGMPQRARAGERGRARAAEPVARSDRCPRGAGLTGGATAWLLDEDRPPAWRSPSARPAERGSSEGGVGAVGRYSKVAPRVDQAVVASANVGRADGGAMRT